MSTSTVTRPNPMAQEQKDSTALARRAEDRAITAAEILGPHGIDRPDTFTTALAKLRERFNVLAPPVQVVGGFAPCYTLIASQVAIDARVNDQGAGPETYYDKGFMKPDDRALNRVGLQRIANAAGLKWTERTGRSDDCKTQYVWAYYAEGTIDTADGSYQLVTGSTEIDLRDGSPQIGGWTPELWAEAKKQGRSSVNGWSEARVRQARARGLALAETKAKNRAIRSIGLQQTYTVKELDKPFIVFRAQFQPDMSDPEVRRMVTERALHGRRALYPQPHDPTAIPRLMAPIPPAGTIDADVVPEGLEAPLPPAAPMPVAPPVSAPPDPPTHPDGLDPDAPDAEKQDVPVVTDVTVAKSGTKNNKAWTLWKVTFSDGASGETFDEDIAALAEACKRNGFGVSYLTEPGKYGAKLTELSRVDPSLPL